MDVPTILPDDDDETSDGTSNAIAQAAAAAQAAADEDVILAPRTNEELLWSDKLDPRYEEMLPVGVSALPRFLYDALMGIVYAYSVKPATFHTSNLMDKILSLELMVPVVLYGDNGAIDALFGSNSRKSNAQHFAHVLENLPRRGACLVYVRIRHFNCYSLARLLSRTINVWIMRVKDQKMTHPRYDYTAIVDHVFWSDISKIFSCSYMQFEAVGSVTEHNLSLAALRNFLERCSYGQGYVLTLLQDQATVGRDYLGFHANQEFSLQVASTACYKMRHILPFKVHHAVLCASANMILGLSTHTADNLTVITSITDTDVVIASTLPPSSPEEGNVKFVIEIEWMQDYSLYANPKDEGARYAGRTNNHISLRELAEPKSNGPAQIKQQALVIAEGVMPFLLDGPLGPNLRNRGIHNRDDIIISVDAPPVIIPCRVVPDYQALKLIDAIFLGSYPKNGGGYATSAADISEVLHCLELLAFKNYAIIAALRRELVVKILSNGRLTSEVGYSISFNGYMLGVRYILPRMLLTAAPEDTALIFWCTEMMKMYNLKNTGSTADANDLINEPSVPSAQYQSPIPQSPPATPFT